MSVTRAELWRLAKTGQIPAEQLSSGDRERLVGQLVREGWSDAALAEHTRQTEYTVARIRERIGLAANREDGTDGVTR